jgi:cytochrome c oxidase subunit 2
MAVVASFHSRNNELAEGYATPGRNPMRIVSIGFILLAALPMAATLRAQATVKEIQMTAKRYTFNPSQVKVKQGDHVKLVITATDHDHGFKLEAFGINQELKKGAATTVEFTADKAGTFPFECSKFCGLGHKRMRGELVVE